MESPSKSVRDLSAFIRKKLSAEPPAWWESQLESFLAGKREKEPTAPVRPNTSIELIGNTSRLEILHQNERFGIDLSASELRGIREAKLLVEGEFVYVIDVSVVPGPNRTRKFNLSSGELLWETKMQRYLENAAGHFRHQTEMQVRNGRLEVFGWARPWIYAFAVEIETGELIWEFSWVAERQAGDKELFIPK